MKQKHTLRRMTPLLLCSAAFLTLPGASFAQSTQEQQKPPAAQSQPQAPAATQTQAPSAQPQRDEQKSGASQSGTQTQTQGQAPSSRSGDRKSGDQDKKAQSPAAGSGQQQTQSPASSGQNAQSPQRSGTSQQTQSPSTSGTQTTQSPQGGTPTQQNAQTPRSGQQPSAAGQTGGSSASLTDQQRTKISTSISQANVQPLRNVNFSINVGTAVPSSVRFYPVTRAMIDVYPQYRGHHFVVVNEEIVIIEPRTRKIVTVLPNQGGGQATLRSKLKLSDQQRNVIRSSVRRPSSSTTTTGSSTTIEKEITIGDSLPETVVIERFPDTVYRQVPSMRSYQYITRDRGVYVVDPRERRVIDLID